MQNGSGLLSVSATSISATSLWCKMNKAVVKQNSVYSSLGSNIAAVEKMGKWLFDCGLFGIKNVAQGSIIALTCMIENKSPIDVLREYHITSDGKILNRADSMQAKFQASGGRIRWIKSNDNECNAKFVHERCPEGFEVHLTTQKFIDNGVALGKNGQMKENWRRFPAQMLRARAISEGVRVAFPECIVGLYTPEEAADFTPLECTAEVIEEHQQLLPPSLSDKIDSAIAYFQESGITKADIENFINKPTATWSIEDLKRLGIVKKEVDSLENAEDRQNKLKSIFNLKSE